MRADATSVDLAKSVVGPRVSGYVNAVLRRVTTRDLAAWLDIVAPHSMTDRDGYLATRYSHPRWIVAAYRDALGDPADAELAQALEAGNARPRVTMAAFPAGPPRDEVMPPGAEAGRWSPYAFTLASGDPAPLIGSGAAVVQDEASQLAAIALSRAPVTPRAGQGHGGAERWLDMCAGPGGKSRLLAGLTAANGATLVAAELHPHRATLVREALTRTRRAGELPPHAVIVADGTRPAWPDGTFDRVLLDVPCSGLGALRRRPEARWRKSEADLKELTALQRDLLRSALAAARPGGVVAYVTCSPVPAETTDVIADVVTSLPGTDIIDAPAVLSGIPVPSGIPGARSASPLFAQLWPHRHGTDAIFIALLRRGTQ
jgi:16S rRNA (cytosine967-C5)-methyltransferase